MSLEAIAAGLYDFDPTESLLRGNQMGTENMRIALESQRQMFDLAGKAADSVLQAQRNDLAARSQMFNEMMAGLNRLDEMGARASASAQNDAMISSAMSGGVSASGGYYGPSGAGYDYPAASGDSSLPSWGGTSSEGASVDYLSADTPSFNAAPTSLPNPDPVVTNNGNVPIGYGNSQVQADATSFNAAGTNAPPPNLTFAGANAAPAAPQPDAIQIGSQGSRPQIKGLSVSPAERDKLIHLTIAEIGSQADFDGKTMFAETVRNRALHRGQSLADTMSPNYYEPLGAGSVRRGVSRFGKTPKDSPAYEEAARAVDRALSGSNLSNNALHNYWAPEWNEHQKKRNNFASGMEYQGEIFYRKTGEEGFDIANFLAPESVQPGPTATPQPASNGVAASPSSALFPDGLRPDGGAMPVAPNGSSGITMAATPSVLPEQRAVERARSSLQSTTEEKAANAMKLSALREQLMNTETVISAVSQNRDDPERLIKANGMARQANALKVQIANLETQNQSVIQREKTLEGALKDAEAAFLIASDNQTKFVQTNPQSPDRESMVDAYLDADPRERFRMRTRFFDDKAITASFDAADEFLESQSAASEGGKVEATVYKVGGEDYTFDDVVRFRDKEPVQKLLESNPKLAERVAQATNTNTDGSVTVRLDGDRATASAPTATPETEIRRNADGSVTVDSGQSSPQAGSRFIQSIR